MERRDDPAMEMARSGRTVQENITYKPEVDSESRKWQLTATDVIDDIRHWLQGQMLSDEPGKLDTWMQVTDAKANQQGIGDICLLLSVYLNKNLHLSYFTPQQIDIILIDFEKSLTRKMESDRDKWGVRKEDMDQVFLMIANTVWAGINRARFGGEKQFLEGTEQRRILSMEGDPRGMGSGKKSLFDRIPILGGLGK